MFKKLTLIALAVFYFISPTQSFHMKTFYLNFDKQEWQHRNKKIADFNVETQGDATFDGTTVTFSSKKTWQGIYTDLPAHTSSWGPNPSITVLLAFNTNLQCQTWIQYTNKQGNLVMANLIKVESKEPSTKNRHHVLEGKNSYHYFTFALPDLDPQQPIRFAIQQLNLGDSGTFTLNARRSSKEIEFGFSTPRSSNNAQIERRKEHVREMHTAFISTRGDLAPYREALETLAEQLVERYKDDISYKNHERIESMSSWGHGKGALPCVHATDLSSIHYAKMLEAFPKTAADITLERFDQMLGYNTSKASAEVLFTRFVIWFLSPAGTNRIYYSNSAIVSLSPWIVPAAAPHLFIDYIVRNQSYESFPDINHNKDDDAPLDAAKEEGLFDDDC